GEGPRVSHRRLIAQLPGTSRILVLRGPTFHGRQRPIPGAIRKGLPIRASWIARNNRVAATRTAARVANGQATAAARGGAGRRTKAGGATQEDPSRLTCGLRRPHAGDGGLHAAPGVHGA